MIETGSNLFLLFITWAEKFLRFHWLVVSPFLCNSGITAKNGQKSKVTMTTLSTIITFLLLFPKEMAARFLEISEEETKACWKSSKQYSQNYHDMDECLEVVGRKQWSKGWHSWHSTKLKNWTNVSSDFILCRNSWWFENTFIKQLKGPGQKRPNIHFGCLFICAQKWLSFCMWPNIIKKQVFPSFFGWLFNSKN